MEYTKKDVCDAMKTHIDEIVKHRKEMLELNKKIEDLSSKNKLKEKTLLVEIDNVLDGNGKKMFSNATKREIELEQRLSNDNIYQNNQSEVTQIDERIKQISIILEYNDKMFRMFETISRL